MNEVGNAEAMWIARLMVETLKLPALLLLALHHASRIDRLT